MSNSVRPYRRQPTRLPHPWDSPGKNTGVGCHFLLQCVKVKSEREVVSNSYRTPWTAAYQAPPSMGFSRQEYWSGAPLPSPKFLLSLLNSDFMLPNSVSLIIYFINILTISAIIITFHGKPHRFLDVSQDILHDVH